MDTAQNSSHHHAEEAARILLRGLIPITLVTSGVYLLVRGVPGWSMIIGVPMLIFGIVFIIYTYDEVVSKKVDRDIQSFVCSACGQLASNDPASANQNNICEVCKAKKYREFRLKQ